MTLRSISTADPSILADPERQLALSYAVAAHREALSLLWQLDERMGGIVAAAREPAIGAMRLIWWRDALARLDMSGAAPPAEPLLTGIARALLPRGLSGKAISTIEEGWTALLEEEEPGEAQIIAHAEMRGGQLFALSAHLLQAEAGDVERAGQGWALADIGHRSRAAETRRLAREHAVEKLAAVDLARWPPALRPLGLLTVYARQDAALATDRQRRQGSPARLLRGLAYRLTGR